MSDYQKYLRVHEFDYIGERRIEGRHNIFFIYQYCLSEWHNLVKPAQQYYRSQSPKAKITERLICLHLNPRYIINIWLLLFSDRSHIAVIMRAVKRELRKHVLSITNAVLRPTENEIWQKDCTGDELLVVNTITLNLLRRSELFSW